MKNIPIIITIITIVFSVGGSVAVIQSKTSQVDELKKQVETTNVTTATLDTKIGFLMDDLKELKESVKEILREVKK